jgi:hypothetical protein
MVSLKVPTDIGGPSCFRGQPKDARLNRLAAAKRLSRPLSELSIATVSTGAEGGVIERRRAKPDQACIVRFWAMPAKWSEVSGSDFASERSSVAE